MNNSRISLDLKSQARIDAVNSIKYTLLLDYKVPELYEEKDFITRLMEACQQCCRGLFTDNEYKIDYNFFGIPQLQAASPLSFLNSFPVHVDSKTPKNETGFHTMILHHCILSSYHAVITELLGDQQVTSYDIVNKIKNQGIYSLYKSGSLCFSENGAAFEQMAKNSGVKKSSLASDFTRRTDSHANALSSIMDTSINKDSVKRNSAPRYQLQFSALSHYICNKHASDFNFLNGKNKKRIATDTLLKKIEDLTRKMEPQIKLFTMRPEDDFSSIGKNPVDGLYHYYLAERIFNFNLFYSLLKNIKRIERDKSYRLCQEETISILSCCKELPNIFSRQYFLKYAFDPFIDKPHSYNDFWYSQDIEKSGVMVGSARRIPPEFQFSRWIEQYRLFMNYMSQFVIPVYEWCFVNMLLDTIEKRYPDKGHFFHLIEAKGLLSTYMSDNYQEILRPIDLGSDMEMVDIITKHKNIEELNELPRKAINQIVNDYFGSKNSLDLNLKPIDPYFFKTDNTRRAESNSSRIRKFYIDLIRYTHLD